MPPTSTFPPVWSPDEAPGCDPPPARINWLGAVQLGRNGTEVTGADEFVRATPHASSLKQRLADGDPLLGPLLRMPNEMLVELTGLVGMDFVVLDTEHGPSDQIPLGQHLTAAAAAGIPALVRVGQLSEILRVLDLGAAGIIVPHVSTVEQAEQAVRAANYPPRGDRGFATYSRAGRLGLADAAEHLRIAAGNTAVVVMIEDADGVAAAEQIAAVPGVDGLFVGPADLAVALGRPGEQGGPEVQHSIRSVHDGARRAGKAVISITADAASARAQFAAGATMVIYNAMAALGGLFSSLADGRPRTDDGVQPAEADEGSQVPLILLPGMLSTPRVWDAVIPLLDSLTVTGFRTDRDDSIAGMAESVLAQAPQRFSLAGHSLGGLVALEIARRAPHRLVRLVLVNCSARGPSPAQLDAWSALADRTAAGDFEAVICEQATVNLGPAAAEGEVMSAWLADARSVGPDGLLRQLAAQRTRADNRPLLPGITVPTLVLGGGRDRVCPAHLQMEMAAALPASRLVDLEGAGHLSLLDSPGEIARQINAFLFGR